MVYFLIIILFAQCTSRIQLYNHHERFNVDIKNLKLVPGHLYRITTKNLKVRWLIYDFSEEGQYIGHSKKRNPEQIKITISEIIKIELIEKDPQETSTFVFGIITVAGIVALIWGVKTVLDDFSIQFP